MAQDIVTVLKVETGSSEKTIKALRDEIKTLKSTLEGAEIGSDKFKQASEELAAAQNKLKMAMDATKQTAKSADGSYDALVATMAQLKKEWKATNDEVKRSEIGKQIAEINTQLKDLDSSIGNAQRNVGNYKQDFVDAMTEMKGGAFDFGQEMTEMNKKTEVTRTALDGVGQVAAGLASGFAAVQGVTALMGIENENLEKTLVKVQAAMAIAQGIGGMKGLVEGAGKLITVFKSAKMGSAALATQNGVTTATFGATATATTVATGALQTFKAALISTGVGALVVALGTLIGYLVTLGDEAEDTKGDIDDMNDSLEDFKETMDKIEKKQSWDIRFKKAGGASEKEILEAERDNARANWNRAFSNQRTLRDSLAMARRGGDEDAIKRAEEAYNNALAITEDYNNKLKDANNAITEYEIRTMAEGKEKAAKAAADAAKAKAEAAADAAKKEEEDAKKRKDAADAVEEQVQIDLKEGKEKEIAILTAAYEEKKKILEADGRSIEDLTALHKRNLKEIDKAYDGKEVLKNLNKGLTDSSNAAAVKEQGVNNSYAIKQADATSPVEQIQLEIDKTLELQAIKEQAFNEQMAQIQAVLDAEKEKDVLTAEQEEELRKQFNTIQAEKVATIADTNTQIALLDKDLKDQQKLSQKEMASNIANTFTVALSSASRLLDAIESNMDKTTEEGFERSKKMRIASATMSTLEGIIGAWTSAMSLPAPFSFIVGGIQSAATAAMGAVQIAAIKKQKFGGEGGLNGAGATPNINLNDSMPIQYTRELMTDTETANINKEQRVYVLESDITETQENVAVKEANASF